jgi:hypothetical protein
MWLSRVDCIWALTRYGHNLLGGRVTSENRLENRLEGRLENLFTLPKSHINAILRKSPYIQNVIGLRSGFIPRRPRNFMCPKQRAISGRQ